MLNSFQQYILAERKLDVNSMEQANKGSISVLRITRHMYNVAGKEDAARMQHLEKYFPSPQQIV